MQWTGTFKAFMSLPPVVPTTGAISISPHDPGNLGTPPQTWTTQVTGQGLNQVKWQVVTPNMKTINLAYGSTTNSGSVPNYNSGDIINFTGYGTGFTLTRVGTTGSVFRAQGSTGFDSITIPNETDPANIRYQVDGTGGQGIPSYTLTNLTNNVGSITATFTRSGDVLIVKSLDETLGDTSGPVIFNGTAVKKITLTPTNPGDLGTAPKDWTTTANVTGLTQVKWAVFDANFNSSMTWQTVNVTNGTVSITCTFKAVGDRLVVKSLDDTVEAVSGQVAFGTVVKSISISPSNPGDLGTAPKTWTTTATATGLSQIKWAVFDTNFNSDMTWQVVNVTNNSASITCTFKAVGDRLVVKSVDDAVETVSGQVSFSSTGGNPDTQTDAEFVASFFQDLTVGPNIEREAGAGRSRAYFDKLKSDSNSTHIRLFIPTKNSWGFPTDATIKTYLTSIANAVAAGFKVFIDLQDVCEPADVYSDPSTGKTTLPAMLTYLSRAGGLIADQNFDKRKVAVGAVQEWAYKTNVFYEKARTDATAALRAKLPGFLLIENGADWNAPTTLVNGTFNVSADKRVCYQWHEYNMSAELQSAAKSTGDKVKTWADGKGVVAFCGEWGKGPASGPADGLPTTLMPDIINAICKGAGHQRPLLWTITNGTWWKMNTAGTLDLKPANATALVAGDTYIKTQSYYVAPSTTPTTPTMPSDPTPSPGTSDPQTVIDVLHRGQSNAYYADQYGGPARLKETLASLTGITINMISRKETTNNTIHSGTYTYWKSPYNSDGRWINPPSNDATGYASAPSSWTNASPMTQTVAATTAYVNADSKVPLIDAVLHWEYDLAMEDSASKTAYPNAILEPGRRILAARPKDSGKYIRAILYCPYQGGAWNSLNTITTTWGAHTSDSTKNTVWGCGNMMDGQPNTQYTASGDFSHWGDQSAPRIYPRVAFNLAKIIWQRGWCASTVDLSDCPSMGPYIASATRSGSTSVVVTITHDKGNALVQGIDGIDWAAFTYTSNSGAHVAASGGAILTATTVRVDWSAAVPNTGNERVFHCYNPNFRRKQLIRDNWHTIRPAKYANVPNIAVVEFPIQRTNSGVVF